MLRCVDTFSEIPSLFPKGVFELAAWRAYAQTHFGKDASLFEDDMNDCLQTGSYTYEKDYLPVLQAVWNHPRLEEMHQSFLAATEGLSERLAQRFGGLDADLVLYVGLCNGAGWATALNGRDAVLLGMEKILELGWVSLGDMQGLIYHELGHIYHSQHGCFRQKVEEGPQRFVWQLFAEGVAMYFEQELAGDDQFYQQDKNGWRAWCSSHFAQIAEDFDRDLPAMTRANQRYFGDWVNYQGRGDVGYYLGTRFLRSLLEDRGFEEVLGFSVKTVWEEYREFVRKTLGRESVLPSFPG